MIFSMISSNVLHQSSKSSEKICSIRKNNNLVSQLSKTTLGNFPPRKFLPGKTTPGLIPPGKFTPEKFSPLENSHPWKIHPQENSLPRKKFHPKNFTVIKKVSTHRKQSMNHRHIRLHTYVDTKLKRNVFFLLVKPNPFAWLRPSQINTYIQGQLY